MNSTKNLNTVNFNPMRDVNLVRWFVMPTIILLIAINIFPLLWSLILSFTQYSAKMRTEWGVNPEAIGVGNYLRLLGDPDIWTKFITTGKYVIMSVGGEMVLGFGLALLLQTKFKGRELISTLLVLPMTMSPVIVGLMWKLFMDPNWGMFNYVLGLGRIDWAQNPDINLYSIVIVDIWMWTPFVMLLSMAGLSAVPKSLYEAAEVDRASWWSKFINITLPTCYPLLLIALIFRVMEAFKIFDLPMGFVGRGTSAPPLLATQLYTETFLTWKTSYGAALGYIMLIIIIAITSVLIKYLNQAKQ
ncbi:MAG: sugar ABC transporter permease [Spirochaetales bacterium]|nr:sugar ABC transporter permease [Spirochaetales bacterium]MCF7937963.1 sugar ABC transporter permease [Spirochaetales bacterium]